MVYGPGHGMSNPANNEHDGYFLRASTVSQRVPEAKTDSASADSSDTEDNTTDHSPSADQYLGYGRRKVSPSPELVEAVAQLQQQISDTSATSAPSAESSSDSDSDTETDTMGEKYDPIKAMGQFSGEETIDQSLVYIRKLQSLPGTEANKLSLLPFLLTDTAAKWLHTLPAESKDTVDHFSTSFKKRFGIDADAKWKLEADLHNKKQLANQSTMAFIDTMVSSATDLEIGEGEHLNIILKGLRPQIQQFMLTKQPKTVEELKSFARLADTVVKPEEDTKVLAAITAVQEQLQELQLQQETQAASVAALSQQSPRSPRVRFRDSTPDRSRSNSRSRGHRDSHRDNHRRDNRPNNGYRPRGRSFPHSASICKSCGRSGHYRDNCRYRHAICNFCKIKGHIQPACFRAKRQTQYRK